MEEEEEDSTQHSSILLKNIEHGWMDGWMNAYKGA
jgi:hypothetical protein